jgi:hypothetical protein
LKSSEVVQLEVALMNYNAGAPEAIDIFQFMADHAFVMYDICRIHQTKPVVLGAGRYLVRPKGLCTPPPFFQVQLTAVPAPFLQ